MMGQLINDVKLFNRKLVNFIENIQRRDIFSIPLQSQEVRHDKYRPYKQHLNNVNELVNSGIATAKYVRTHNSKLSTNRLNQCRG